MKKEIYWSEKEILRWKNGVTLERVISKYGWPKQSVGRWRSKWKKIHFECFYKIDFGTRTCAVNPLWYTDFTLSRFVLGSAPLTAPAVSFCSGPAPPIHPPAGPITPLLIAPPCSSRVAKMFPSGSLAHWLFWGFPFDNPTWCGGAETLHVAGWGQRRSSFFQFCVKNCLPILKYLRELLPVKLYWANSNENRVF